MATDFAPHTIEDHLPKLFVAVYRRSYFCDALRLPVIPVSGEM